MAEQKLRDLLLLEDNDADVLVEICSFKGNSSGNLSHEVNIAM